MGNLMTNQPIVSDAERMAQAMDKIATRLKLWTSAIILVCAIVAAATAACIKWITQDVHNEIAQTRQELQEYIRLQHVQSQADSMRIEAGLDIIQLAVVAIVEPSGSDEQRVALSQLRARRSYIPKR